MEKFGLSIDKIIEIYKRTGYSPDFILLGKEKSSNEYFNNYIKNLQSQIKEVDNTIKLISSTTF